MEGGYPTMAMKPRSTPFSRCICEYFHCNLDQNCLFAPPHPLSHPSLRLSRANPLQNVEHPSLSMVAVLLLDCLAIVTSLIFGMVSLRTTEQLKMQLD